MTEAEMDDIARDGIWTMIKVSAPALIAGLVVGIAIALLQSVTQLQEATLTFVPKALVVFGVLVLVLPYMIHTMDDFWKRLLDLMIVGTG
jgi:flagellar biosynthetic protein FliQ